MIKRPPSSTALASQQADTVRLSSTTPSQALPHLTHTPCIRARLLLFLSPNDTSGRFGKFIHDRVFVGVIPEETIGFRVNWGADKNGSRDASALMREFTGWGVG